MSPGRCWTVPGALPLRIGINRGHVFAGDFGPSFRRTFSVKGDAINLAARVMGKAAARPGAGHPGGGRAVARPLFRTTELPAVPGQGQVAARAGGRGRPARWAPARERAPRCRWSGATSEMAVLGAGAGRRPRRTGRLVEVVGEPGSASPGWSPSCCRGSTTSRVVAVACEQYESVHAVLAVPPAAARRARACPPMLPTTPRSPTSADGARLGERPAPRGLAAAPRPPLDVELPATRETRELDEEFRKARLEERRGRAAGRRCSEHPTVLVVEDAHRWTSPRRPVCTELADELADRPWLLVVTRRDDATGFVPGRRLRSASVRPRPLDAAERLEVRPGGARRAPAAAAGDGGPRRTGWRQPDVPRGAGARRRPIGLGGRPARVGRGPGHEPDRPAPTRRTALVLRYAAVLGTTVDEEALDGCWRTTAAALDPGAIDRLADFLVRDRPGGSGSATPSCATWPTRAFPTAVATALHARVGNTIEASASATRRSSASCCRCTSSTPASTTRPGATRCSPANARLRSTPMGEAIDVLRTGRPLDAAPRAGRPARGRPGPRAARRCAVAGRPAAGGGRGVRPRPPGPARTTPWDSPGSSRRRRGSTSGTASTARRCVASPGASAGSTGSPVPTAEMARSLLARRYADSLVQPGSGRRGSAVGGRRRPRGGGVRGQGHPRQGLRGAQLHPRRFGSTRSPSPTA